MTDDYTQAEIVRSLQRIEKSQEALTQLVTSQGTTYVTRVEFDLVRTAQEKTLNEIKAESAARRAPWWSVMSAVAGLVAVAVAIIVALP